MVRKKSGLLERLTQRANRIRASIYDKPSAKLFTRLDHIGYCKASPGAFLTLQGYLAHKKTHPPRTRPYAYA